MRTADIARDGHDRRAVELELFDALAAAAAGVDCAVLKAEVFDGVDGGGVQESCEYIAHCLRIHIAAALAAYHEIGIADLFDGALEEDCGGVHIAALTSLDAIHLDGTSGEDGLSHLGIVQSFAADREDFDSALARLGGKLHAGFDGVEVIGTYHPRCRIKIYRAVCVDRYSFLIADEFEAYKYFHKTPLIFSAQLQFNSQ